ncbi:hypothetical protein [Flavobacterium sp.]|uniref:hypothetical protein n=1 Tax=Flavobacterium sp. TaxID=239 RepID=UPI0025F0A9A7|nr:hypothetical protein [Flavobacterium sp.]
MRALAHIPSKTITSGYRAIKDGSRYNTYFPPPDERDRVIIKDGEVTDTVELMEKVVWKYLDDTKRIAPLLMRPSTHETCQAIWEFIHNFIQYKLDQRGLEQLRRPARSWAERATGVDCDCMSIFTSSILTNLKIPHSFRITKYSQDSWQHVYVIVPIAGANNYCVIDAVVSEFNYEKKYTDKMDYTMNLKGINVAVLSGISGNDHYEAVMATSLSGIGLGATTNQSDLDKLYQNLVATRNAVAQNPSLVSTVDDPQALIKMLDYAIQYWYTDKRNEALDILAKNEAQLNLQNGVNAMNGLDYDPDDLALSGINVKGFFTNVKKTVKTVGQKVGQAAKVAVKAVVKFNPLSIAARGGFLLAMKLNLGKMASKLKWAYGTQQQAAAKNVSATTWQKSKDALVKVEKLFADKLQGSRVALKNAILKGRAGNLSGYVEEQMSGYLGDPASATVIAAAAPVIIATIKILKESGLIGKDENVDMNSLTNEVNADPGAAQAAAEFQETDPNAIEKMALTTQPETSLAPATTTNDPSVTPKASGGGIMNFIKTNPVPAVIGGGLLAFGIYQLVKPKKKATGLSGYRTKRKPATTTRKTLPKKTTTSSRTVKGRSKKNITPVKLF